MSRQTFVTQEPVQLEGYQAVMKPSKFGYSLVAIVDQDINNSSGCRDAIEDEG